MLFYSQLGGLFEGVGAIRAGSAALGPWFYDGLAEALKYNFIPIV